MVGSTMSVVESAQIEGFGEVAGMVLGGIIQFIGLIISGMIQIAAFIGDIKNGWDALCEGITTKFSSTMDNVKKWWSDFKTKFGLDSDSMKNRWNSVCDGIKISLNLYVIRLRTYGRVSKTSYHILFRQLLMEYKA